MSHTSTVQKICQGIQNTWKKANLDSKNRLQVIHQGVSKIQYGGKAEGIMNIAELKADSAR